LTDLEQTITELKKLLQASLAERDELLQQQAATNEVLQVINASSGDLAPVFDAILERAMRLCEARFGLMAICDAGHIRTVATRGVPPAFAEFRENNPPVYGPETGPGRILAGERVVHIADLESEDAYRTGDPNRRAVVDLGGARTVLLVPLLENESVLGFITIYRKEVRPYSDKQIALLQGFADQAVIAIGNVRLFDEVQARTEDLRESLQQQTATADVLKVISRSTFDLQAVLDTLVESAARLCEADKGVIFKRDGDLYRWSANFGNSLELEAFAKANPFKPGRYAVTSRVALEGKTFLVSDVLADPEYGASKYQKLGGYRTILGVPLLREGTPIGVFALTRSDVKPFTPKQVELVETFADQAVIAIENVRLFDEVQLRTNELSQSLEDLRTAQDRLVQTEKLASLGQLTAGIAHEIKNPLNFVNNFSALSAELTDELNVILKSAGLGEKMREEVDELTGMLKDNLEKVVQHGKRADSIVKNMLLHSREGAGEHRPADINSLLDESLNLAYHGARAEKAGFNITLQRDFDADAGAIELFPQEITRAFLNLISNGFYAANRRETEDEEPGFEPVLRATTKNLGSTVEIRIRDNGTGIPAEVQEKMFNPFFTTKPTGEGTGLGLSMTHDIIVKQHGGRIEVETERGFTEFTVVLPRTNKVRGRDHT
jgi:two-component system, NtrC family, sensor kinase